MRKGSIVSASLACLVVVAAAGDALAKPRYRISGAPDRDSRGSISRYDAGRYGPNSWLYPGTKVPVGTESRYMVEQTRLQRDPITENQRGWYMGETLPRPLYNEWDPGLPIDLLP